MADLSNLVVEYNRKVQLEQFEPVDFGVTAEVIPDEDETIREAYHEAALAAEDMVDREITRRIVSKKETSTE